MGMFEARIRFGAKVFTVPFLILEKFTGGILLGIDFLTGAHSGSRCGNLELQTTEQGEQKKKWTGRKTWRQSHPRRIHILDKQRQVFENISGLRNIRYTCRMTNQ